MAASYLLPCYALVVAVLMLFFSVDVAEGAIREYQFDVQMTNVTRLCSSKSIVTVNGQFPGPTVFAREGDFVVIRVVNHVPYNMSIHWHGIRQLRSGWADGPAYITQCPIQSGQSYVYKFTITGQRGTLWWHAHISWLRATVYGPIVILPKAGVPYPFPAPYKEVPVIFGEWWTADTEAVISQALQTGGGPNVSDAFTINGLPGPLYNCSAKDVHAPHHQRCAQRRALLLHRRPPAHGRRRRRRLHQAHYRGDHPHHPRADHQRAPHHQAVLPRRHLLHAGRALLHRQARHLRQHHGRRHPRVRGPHVTCPARGLQQEPPGLEADPAADQRHELRVQLHGQAPQPGHRGVPGGGDAGGGPAVLLHGGAGHAPVRREWDVPGPHQQQPVRGSREQRLLRAPDDGAPAVALRRQVQGVYSSNFPAAPLVPFNYTGTLPNNTNVANGTKLVVLPYGATVELVMQGTSILGAESHPLHLHGFNFFVVGQGFGNFDPAKDPAKYNLVDPVERNTVGVPAAGWVAIRFCADNPGVWFMHCHLEVHVSWGLKMAWLVLDGDGPNEKLLPPPSDLPRC